MLQKHLLKMLMKRYHSDSAKKTNVGVTLIPARFYVFKLNNRNIRKRRETFSRLTMSILEQYQLKLFWCCHC